jgi:tetratricopeptide (TPR) repeat protein
LPFDGSIEEISLFDIFQLLSLSQKSGALTIDLKDEEIKIFFRRGKIIAVKKGDFIKLKDEAQETIFAVLDSDRGHFSFNNGETPGSGNENFSLKVDNLILEASRRIDELEKIKENLPTEKTVIMLSPKAADAENLDLNTKDWEIISYVDGIRSVGEIIEIIGNEYETRKHIYGLVKTGLLTEVEEGFEKEKKSIAKGPKQILLDTADEFYHNGNVEAAKAILGKIASSFPEKREILYNFACVLTKSGNFKRAKEITSELLLNPGNVDLEDIGRLDNLLDSLMKIIK